MSIIIISWERDFLTPNHTALLLNNIPFKTLKVSGKLGEKEIDLVSSWNNEHYIYISLYNPRSQEQRFTSYSFEKDATNYSKNTHTNSHY